MKSTLGSGKRYLSFIYSGGLIENMRLIGFNPDGRLYSDQKTATGFEYFAKILTRNKTEDLSCVVTIEKDETSVVFSPLNYHL